MPDEHILIADDEADVLDTCVRALSMEGYQICGVHSGLEAIEMVKKQSFDLLLTDIKMPGITGLQAYGAIKQHDPDIVGVAITGYGSTDMAIEALRLGIYDFLLKPFSVGELSAAVSKALEKKRLERENARLKALIPLFQLSQAFIAVTDLDALLRQVLQVAVRETAADIGVLILKNDTSGDWEVCSAVTDTGSELPKHEYKPSDSIIRQTLQSQQPTIWRREPGQTSFFALETVNARVSTGVALPLIIQGDMIGILSLDKGCKKPPFARSDVELLSVVASQASIAIQNARLFTRIRNAYEKLSALDHLKSEFISIAAHELRTPLAEIGTYLAVLEHESKGGNLCLAGIARALDRLTALINDITDLTFLQAGQVELKRASFSLPQLLAESLEQLGPLAARKGLSITTSIADSFPSICADARKVKVVLKNLISNAIKFTPAGGAITIGAEADGNEVRVAVQDTGIGIPEEEWEWVFKPFYQLENSLVREHGGIGLGLAIAKNLIELHSGRIWIESAVGKGSTFYFTLPDCLCQPGA